MCLPLACQLLHIEHFFLLYLPAHPQPISTLPQPWITILIFSLLKPLYPATLACHRHCCGCHGGWQPQKCSWQATSQVCQWPLAPWFSLVINGALTSMPTSQIKTRLVYPLFLPIFVWIISHHTCSFSLPYFYYYSLMELYSICHSSCLSYITDFCYLC